MGLLTCRDCGRQVSDTAPSCPGCGRVFAPAPQRREGLFLSTLNFGCAILFILIGFIGFATCWQYERSRPPTGIEADLERASQPTPGRR